MDGSGQCQRRVILVGDDHDVVAPRERGDPLQPDKIQLPVRERRGHRASIGKADTRCLYLLSDSW
jgi:hypothetical protein